MKKWAEYSTDSHHLPPGFCSHRTINYTPTPFFQASYGPNWSPFFRNFGILSSCSIYPKSSWEKKIMHLSGKNNEGKFQQAVIYQTQASFLLGKFTLGHLYMQVCRCMHSDLKVKFKLGNWLIHDQNKTRCVSSHNMYLGQKSYVRVKFYLKLRNLNFSFRMKIK